MTIFTFIVSICSGVMTIIGLLTLFIKPIREKVLKTKEAEAKQEQRIKDAESISLSLALSEMTKTYYQAMEEGQIRQYKYEAFQYLYENYKNLGGNHFADKMKADLDQLKIIT